MNRAPSVVVSTLAGLADIFSPARASAGASAPVAAASVPPAGLRVEAVQASVAAPRASMVAAERRV